MKNTKNPNWIRSIVSTGLATAIFATSSMIALAGSTAPQGDLSIAGGDNAFVLVDGERAYNGRTVSATSTVTTAENSATVNLGKAGRVELAPNSSLNLNFSEAAISGTLSGGSVKVVSPAGVEAKIQTKDGVVVNEAKNSSAFSVNVNNNATEAATETGAVYMNNGKSVTRVGKKDDGDKNGVFGLGENSAIPLAVFAGVVAVAVIYVATHNGDGNNATVSPVR